MKTTAALLALILGLSLAVPTFAQEEPTDSGSSTDQPAQPDSGGGGGD
jgi:hypothetical protein